MPPVCVKEICVAMLSGFNASRMKTSPVVVAMELVRIGVSVGDVE